MDAQAAQAPGRLPTVQELQLGQGATEENGERSVPSMSEYYTIDSEKLAAITASVQQKIPRMTESHVREYCLADWPEGQEHQDWLDSAPVSEIADWVVTGNLERFFAAPGDYHEAWCKIWDDVDGEYLTGTIESVPDDQTFVVRAVPSGRLWECRHDLYGEVLECEVINANL